MTKQQLETQPFTKPETFALVKRIQQLEAKYGSDKFRARLQVQERAYRALVARGFEFDLADSCEVVGSHPGKQAA